MNDRTQDYLDGLHAGAENGRCCIEELRAEIERLQALIHNGKLYVTDDEIATRLGCPREITRKALECYDRDIRSGFPKPQPLFGNRRYWPAVRDYFDRANGLFPGRKG